MSFIVTQHTKQQQLGAKAPSTSSASAGNQSTSVGTQSTSVGTLETTARKLPVATKSTQAVAETTAWKIVPNRVQEHTVTLTGIRVLAEHGASKILTGAWNKAGHEGTFHVSLDGEISWTGPKWCKGTKYNGKYLYDFVISGKATIEVLQKFRGADPTVFSLTYVFLAEARHDVNLARELNKEYKNSNGETGIKFRVQRFYEGKALPYNKVVVPVGRNKYKVFFTVWGPVPEDIAKLPTFQVLQVWKESETEKKFRMSAAQRREKNRQNQKRRSAWKKAATGKREAKVEKKSVTKNWRWVPKPISVQPAPEKAWVSENLAEEVEKLSVEEFPDLKADC